VLESLGTTGRTRRIFTTERELGSCPIGQEGHGIDRKRVALKLLLQRSRLGITKELQRVIEPPPELNTLLYITFPLSVENVPEKLLVCIDSPISARSCLPLLSCSAVLTSPKSKESDGT
jgi:hypothetical protein